LLSLVSESGAQTWTTTSTGGNHPRVAWPAAQGLALDDALGVFCDAVRRGGGVRIVCESVDGPGYENVICTTVHS
jgi:hypothetical protein